MLVNHINIELLVKVNLGLKLFGLHVVHNVQMVVDHYEYLSCLSFAELNDGEFNFLFLVLMDGSLELAEDVSGVLQISEDDVSIDVDGNKEVLAILTSHIHAQDSFLMIIK